MTRKWELADYRRLNTKLDGLIHESPLFPGKNVFAICAKCEGARDTWRYGGMAYLLSSSSKQQLNIKLVIASQRLPLGQAIIVSPSQLQDVQDVAEDLSVRVELPRWFPFAEIFLWKSLILEPASLLEIADNSSSRILEQLANQLSGLSN